MKVYVTLGIANKMVSIKFFEGMIKSMDRFMDNDWGDTCVEDKVLNDVNFKNGGSILASYTVCDTKIWIYREANPQGFVYTIMLPEEW